MGFIKRFKNSWNAFFNKDPTPSNTSVPYYTASYRPDRIMMSSTNGKSIMAPVINRIACDIASMSIEHVRVDKDGRYTETINSKLNDIFNLEANKDQTGQSFVQSIVMSLCDEGVVAIVPIDTTDDPIFSDSYEILTARVAKIVQWAPDNITVNVYNDKTGQFEDLVFPKRIACIIENPFYYLMNAPNSTLQRYLRKMAQLDTLDEKNSAGKLDIIIQLPYSVKTDLKRDQAEMRKRDLERQLVDSKYGIAYMDSSERITQLNRPAENTLIEQIDKLRADFYNQLGMTQSIFDGTADEAAIINYENRTLNVIANAIINEVRRKWISKTARSQGQSIMLIRDPFRHLTVGQTAEAADKFTRNEILSSNEVRAKIGYKPSSDPDADELRNKNLNKSAEEVSYKQKLPNKGENQNGEKI